MLKCGQDPCSHAREEQVTGGGRPRPPARPGRSTDRCTVTGSQAQNLPGVDRQTHVRPGRTQSCGDSSARYTGNTGWCVIRVTGVSWWWAIWGTPSGRYILTVEPSSLFLGCLQNLDVAVATVPQGPKIYLISLFRNFFITSFSLLYDHKF